MRTLLIDNYDSFTYNLFHYLAEVNGREPEVIVNNDPRWQARHLAEFDNVVLSPGPGDPTRPEDFGVCREVLADGGLPTLGVCLGHQGLAALYGARVGRAPEPFHGRTSPVRHLGTDLFEGLPSPFTAVRYHSLAADRLPAELEATAWTPDGVLMGLRHRTRPQWGVQFHPESIGGEHGHALLANFRRLTERFTGRHGARPTGRPAAARPAAPAAPPRTAPAPERRRLRVLTRTLPLRGDGEAAYARLFRHGDHPHWLDSTRPDSADGRYSIMGDASGPLGRVVRADAWTGTLDVRTATGTRTVRSGLLDWLEHDLATLDTRLPDLPFDFALGWVGYLGYELKAECGGSLRHRSEVPDAVLAFTTRALVLDHATGTAHLLALAEDDDERPARRWLDTAARALATLPEPADRAGRPGRTAPPVPPVPPAPTGAPRPRHERTDYLDLIDACAEEIAAGESYEICLTNTLRADGPRDTWQDYRFLRRTSPSPLGALLDFPGTAVLSTSPERFLRIDRHRTAESRPIKGTRPRGDTPEQDARLAADLAASAKDRAENLMIVDLVRNDLGRCAEIGTVRADDLFRVETHARAHQLVSTVRARLRPDSSAVQCVRAAFPPGSMTGAPKLRTMEIIDRLEQGPRGVYSGVLGYFSLTGAADLSVAIRTTVTTPAGMRYGVGGAVIALSDPAAEWEETVVKAAPFLALTGADGLDAPVPAPADPPLGTDLP
ncbi:aminodeoxychorismate synthase component I [Kitasatospora phosalacinea]|uniref:Aminodeoxychorismate synthase n=1 Tax=Kitasatospora phosalacinea TaxID=2065 RepID=A0A9W6PLE8_9ACTN|nr:aminodeoxychorismate synthase component I [Kitasatospora phosalacinea]GLW56986.1 aminodeoxychorismate synthase, component I [Kitasatospora phosalacinea]